jgi:hypothetical protein
MRGIIRLIEGIFTGDPDVVPVVIFAVVGTAILYFAAEIIRKRRKGKGGT